MRLTNLKRWAILWSTKQIKTWENGFSLKSFGTLSDHVQIKLSLLRRHESTLSFHRRKRKDKSHQRFLQSIRFQISFHRLEYLNGQEYRLESKRHTEFKRVSKLSPWKHQQQIWSSGVKFTELRKITTLLKEQQRLKLILIILMKIKAQLLSLEDQVLTSLLTGWLILPFPIGKVYQTYSLAMLEQQDKSKYYSQEILREKS